MDRLRLKSICLTYALSVTIVLPRIALAASVQDSGAKYEDSLQARSRVLFGFVKPVEKSADTPSSTTPGDLAVEVAGNLKVRVVSSNVGENADMIALWPDDANPTHAIICNEINGTVAGAAASVQGVRLSDGQVQDMVFGLQNCDPARRTAWGTVVVGEEAGSSGRLWEIFDPLNVNGITVNRAAGTSPDPDHVIARTALGQLSYEGIVLLPNGTTYYGDELRPADGKPGGGIYKFVPSFPWTSGTVSKLSESPLVAGSVFVMRLGLRSGPTDFGQGTNTGAGRWIGPLVVGNSLAAAALAQGGYTGYYRPEDMEMDPIAAKDGIIRLCWTNTGNDTFAQWGEVLCMEDQPTNQTGFNTGTMPIVTPFVIGNPDLRMPDNLAFQPHTGILYVLMDATTSAEDPNFTNDDVWACLPDGEDIDTLSDGCVRVMTLKDGNAEFTGIQFLADGKSFLIHLQHRTQEGRAVPHTTDMILVSGLRIPN